MTRNFAVIPVKGLLDSKSRLSGALVPQDRKRLVLAMLKDVLTAAQESGLFSRVLVVSPDQDVEREADLHKTIFLPQEGHGLNAGIKQATFFALREKASSVAVLLADIPLMEPRDLKEIYSIGEEAQRVVLSPSFKGGTNVMVRDPPNTITPAYGRWSFSNHLRAAQRSAVAVYSVSNQRLSFDIDNPEDLSTIKELDSRAKTFTARSLEAMASSRMILPSVKQGH